MTTNATWGKLGPLGSRENPNEDPNVMASATTIAPTYHVTRVSGTTTIGTITVPYVGFSGSIVLAATGIWTWDTTGNIAIAGTVTTALGAVIFTYSQYAAKWYPSRLT